MAQGLRKIHPTLPFTQIQGFNARKRGMLIITIQKSRALAPNFKYFQSFQNTFMCPILFESYKNRVKNYRYF